ncbi:MULTISPECIES: restriction endonuclease [Catenuloplanes]|uniref:restriction endonuclease n=1 Tax=Catenuloplanes TaxID=33874 RepID=UPI00286A81A3|nr:restriction endonuclease [Catenuloplanes niger]
MQRHEQPPGTPPPAPVTDWSAAERNAVGWLRWLGHRDATLTRGGADGGIDVIGARVAAQVKWYGKPVGVGPVRELVGAAVGTHVTTYFFCNAGFSRSAVAYADRAGVALFQYSPADGSLRAVNVHAERAYATAVRHRTRSEADMGLKAPLRTAYRSVVEDAPPPDTAGPVSRIAVAVALAPIGMCVAGVLAVIVVRGMDSPPPRWIGQAWAIWMSVACLGVLPFVLVAKLLQDSRTRTWRRHSRGEGEPTGSG